MSEKETTVKVLGWNLGILLFYIIALVLFGRDNGSGGEGFLGGAIMMMLMIALHVGVDIFVGFVFLFKREKSLGQAFLLSAGIVLLIGFSACMGGLELFS